MDVAPAQSLDDEIIAAPTFARRRHGGERATKRTQRVANVPLTHMVWRAVRSLFFEVGAAHISDVPRPNTVRGQALGRLLQSGQLRSFSEISEGCRGHSMPKAGSSQRTPPSAEGS